MSRLLTLVLTVLIAIPAYAQQVSTLEGKSVYCGSSPALIKFAIINQAAGDATIVAAVTGKKIRVMSYVVTADTADTLVEFQSTTATALTGDMRFPDNGILSANCAPFGCFETVAGELLNVQATTGSVDGHITYAECG